MATDIFVIVRYMREADTKVYGWSLLMMIVGCLLCQLMVVYMQNRKRGMAKFVMEALIVLTGLKPGTLYWSFLM